LPGDIRASEVFKDRELLNRLGYGIMDVEWGKGEIGSENILDFSYIIAQDQDPKFYRRLVYDLTGRYFTNDLGKEIWDKFIEHKWVLSERASREIDLKTAAEDWLTHYSHDFLKEWTFTHPVLTTRIRSAHEPRRGWLGGLASLAVPPLGELLDSGFTVSNVAAAVLRETLPLPKIDQTEQEGQEPGQEQTQEEVAQIQTEAETESENQEPLVQEPHHRPSIVGHSLHFLNPFRSRQSRGKGQPQPATRAVFVVNKVKVEEEHEGVQHGFYYVRMLASLTGHHFKDRAEAEYYWREVLEHKWYMSEKAKHDVGIRQAALDYFRRLNLLEQVETGQET
jgi:hypothetical protein